ncbi:hypothetical protein ACHAWF_007042 [Thalassiosira exigua]
MRIRIISRVLQLKRPSSPSSCMASRLSSNQTIPAALSKDKTCNHQLNMTVYDDAERKFGISSYASPHEGFAAVVKARYSDFVVHEVDLNGNVARLESLDTPPTGKSVDTTNATAEAVAEVTRKRKLSGIDELSVQGAVADAKSSNNNSGDVEKTSVINWETCMQELSPLIEDIHAKEVVSFLKGHESASEKEKDDNSQKFYTLPLISDKQVRRSIHMLVKSASFNSIALADNHEGKIRIWHAKYKAEMPADTFGGGGRGGGRNRNNPKKNGNGKRGPGGDRHPWPNDRPDFLRFVLYKENIDTPTAAKDVVRMSGLNPKRGINYAGMKDKRGITSQFCTVYRTEKEKLFSVNGRCSNVAVGHGVGGGGNSSTKGACIVKVGNISYSSEEVKLGALSGNRFDVVLRNVDVGEDVESGDREKIVQQKLEIAGNAMKAHGFINYFGMQRFGKFGDTHLVGVAILKGNFQHAVEIIMREKADEYPRVADARRRWARRFESVDMSTANNDSAKREAELRCARSILKDMGRFMVCERSLVTSLSRKPMDYKRAFGAIAKNMKVSSCLLLYC